MDDVVVFVNGDFSVRELFPPGSVVLGSVPISRQYPLGGEESLDANGATGVDPRSRNTDFCAQTEAVAVSHP